MVSPASRLFRPGDGAAPPALAGREAEQAVLSRCLADLASGSAPPHNVVLIGPRGNGKTVLLNWFKDACAASPAPLEALALTPRDVPTVAALHNALAPRRGVGRLLPRKIAIASVGAAEWSSPDSEPRNLVRDLTVRCRRRPLAVLLDEAHTLALDVGGVLLNASQRVRADAPFLLVLAGTPGLTTRLNAMDASFWARLGPGRLGIGLLDDAAAKEALAKPLAAHRVAVADAALCAVVRQSQRYPYFIQLWGDALWNRHLATGTGQLAGADVAAAQAQVATWVAEYYQDRYRELEAEGLLTAAAGVAPAFQGDDGTAADLDINAALAAAGIEDAASRLASREALHRLGYIWCPPGQPPPIRWHPGIPSLMAYVLGGV